MRLAISTIALPAYDHSRELCELAELGFEGVEVAPSRVFRDTWHGLAQAEVRHYRQQIENAGLVVVGLHSLLFDQANLTLFGDDDARSGLADFFVHLSSLCRDLGGRTLIWGSGRRRGQMPFQIAFEQMIAFLSNLCRRIEAHGTLFCLEPLGPLDSDFINSACESLAVVKAIDHPALRVQLDAKALIENAEATPDTFAAVQDYLVHFHANEPGLSVLGETKAIDHASLGRMLRAVNYQGFVTAEQRMVNSKRSLIAVARSADVLKEHYA